MCSLQTKRQYCTDAITIRDRRSARLRLRLTPGPAKRSVADIGQGPTKVGSRNVARCSWATCWPDPVQCLVDEPRGRFLSLIHISEPTRRS
eukprot:7260069-Prymnesium_polylepis.1